MHRYSRELCFASLLHAHAPETNPAWVPSETAGAKRGKVTGQAASTCDGIQYVMGALSINSSIVLQLGIEDCYSGIVSLPLAQIETLLEFHATPEDAATDNQCQGVLSRPRRWNFSHA